jgi:two-component system chemotaxis response regulator CheB
VNFARPSIDVLFESAAEAYRESLVGVILTGANKDGAAGLSAVAARGGVALVQRPEEAYAAQMPRAAIEACPSARVLGLTEIGEYLRKIGARV